MYLSTYFIQNHIHIINSKFIKFTVLSLDPVARYLPSNEKATLSTGPIVIEYIYIYIYMYI